VASAHDTSTPEQSATIGGLPVRTHDHVCVLYRGEDQRDELMADFLADGIRAGHRCYCMIAADNRILDRIMYSARWLGTASRRLTNEAPAGLHRAMTVPPADLMVRSTPLGCAFVDRDGEAEVDGDSVAPPGVAWALEVGGVSGESAPSGRPAGRELSPKSMEDKANSPTATAVAAPASHATTAVSTRLRLRFTATLCHVQVRSRHKPCSSPLYRLRAIDPRPFALVTRAGGGAVMPRRMTANSATARAWTAVHQRQIASTMKSSTQMR